MKRRNASLGDSRGQLDQALHVAQGATKKLENLTYDVLDHWMKDNQYILTGYRPMSNSLMKSFTSIFAVHNETVNIWTHLVPGLLLLCVLGAILSGKPPIGNLVNDVRQWIALEYPSATRVDGIVLLVFLVGATLMFTASWTYHTVSNHSLSFSKNWNKIDYVGIICMIIGSFFPSVYYGHYCEPKAVRFYLWLLSGFGLITFGFTVLNRFRTPAWRPYRAGMFVALGLSAVIPVIDAVFLKGLTRVQAEMSLSYCAVQGMLYIIGAVIYAKRIPEKHYPKTFDIIGSSHQIFHCCVVLAGIIHAIGVWKAFSYRHAHLHGFCPKT